ncbi:MAG: hypothetical protein MJ109_00965 [Kiritimatiellae bacterium]|nr:hypothetical protein [Kiritimatiellia bacterium]
MAKKMTISAVSNLMSGTFAPPSFAVNPTENMMEASKEDAPVLLRIPYSGTLDGKAFAKMIADESEIGLEEAALYLNVFGEVVGSLAKSAVQFHFGVGLAELSISGSLAAGDEPAESGRHVLQYTVLPTDEVKKTFAAIECRIDSDACPVELKRVRDVDSGDAAIVGTKEFHTKGKGMTFGGLGEKLELYTEDGARKLRDVAVTKHDSQIEAECHLENQLPTGKYFLQLTTLAGGEKTLYPVGINVNCVFVPVEMDEGLKVKVKVGGEGEDTVGVYGGALAEGSTKAKIDWGDGYVEEVTSLSQLSHKYELPGEYTLRISDDVSEIAFSSPIASSPFASEYAKRILEVEGVGEKLTTLRASALMNAANLVNAKFASVDNVLTDVLKGANAIHYIHFAAANETALKASAGYQADARLGSTSARVKFDL